MQVKNNKNEMAAKTQLYKKNLRKAPSSINPTKQVTLRSKSQN